MRLYPYQNKILAVILLFSSLNLFAETMEEYKQRQKAEYEAFINGEPVPSESDLVKEKPQEPSNKTNIYDDVPLDNSSFGSAGVPRKPPPEADNWRRVKDSAKAAAKAAEKTYKSIGSPKYIEGPNGQGGLGLAYEISESTIGSPCNSGSTRCDADGSQWVCKSSLEGKRMAYWWERSGTCSSNVGDQLSLSDLGTTAGSNYESPVPPKREDAFEGIKKRYKSIGSPEHITAPDGSGHGVQFSFDIAESTIGSPCSTGQTRCDSNGTQWVCRSSLEGRRMAYWWERSGSCASAISDIQPATELPQKTNKTYRQIIDYKSLYEQASKAVVLIYSEQPNNTVSKGTGSIISDQGLILTNAHVLGDEPLRISVYLKPDHYEGDGNNTELKNQYIGTLVAIHPQLDLALLRIDTKGGSDFPMPLQLSDLTSVGIGEPTIAIGHPTGGAFWSLTTGRVSAAFENYEGVQGRGVFQTETDMNPGNSGGPLLDGGGSIIGVNSFIRRTHASGLTLTGLNFAVKSTSVLNWIAGLDNTNQQSPTTAKVNSTTTTISSTVSRYADGLFVTHLPSGREIGGMELEEFLKKQQAAFAELEL